MSFEPSRAELAALVARYNAQLAECESQMRKLLDLSAPTVEQAAQYRQLKRQHNDLRVQRSAAKRALRREASRGGSFLSRFSSGPAIPPRPAPSPPACAQPLQVAPEFGGAAAACGGALRPTSAPTSAPNGPCTLCSPRCDTAGAASHSAGSALRNAPHGDVTAEKARREAARELHRLESEKARKDAEFELLHPKMHAGTDAHKFQASLIEEGAPQPERIGRDALSRLEANEKRLVRDHPLLACASRVFICVEEVGTQCLYYACECPCLRKLEEEQQKSWGLHTDGSRRITRGITRRALTVSKQPSAARLQGGRSGARSRRPADEVAI